jgi:hypothetical protein
MDLCKNGKLITISEETITENNFTYTHRIQRCIPDSQPISIPFIIGFSCLMGFFVGLCIACFICSRRSSKVEPTLASDNT